jgi:hypothetical protein
MDKSTGDTTKRKRPDRPGTPVMVRVQPQQLSSLDAWIAHQPDRPSRPEAIRRLVDKGLKGQ